MVPLLHRRSRHLYVLAALLALLFSAGRSVAQGGGAMLINLAPLDGLAITPANILSFTVQSHMPAATEAAVNGTIRYRQSGLSLSYTFRITLRPGMNSIDRAAVRPQWTFSDNAFRELFMDYQFLPQGTYEYCVSINPIGSNGEVKMGEEVAECLYQKADDVFLINLVDPENNAKIHEHYPVFSWIVNYPFASQLTYRIRVAEIREGQNTVNAVARNNPVYTERNLPQTTTTYPVYGTPLKVFQPYAWTVDAYYKGILLGGAEPWKFTIVVDSEMIAIPRESSFVDIRKEQNASNYYAIGSVKLKYVLDERPEEILTIKLLDANGKQVKLKDQFMQVTLGDNRKELDLKNGTRLRHLGRYTLEITNSSNTVYHLPIRYVNPDFL